jgi:FSR family fosmidomycin resistance protein-like MFS transporter
VLLVAGGVAFALSAALTAAAVGFWTLLAALVIGNPATGAFVSLAQATLMDRDPERRERNMAWWTLAGSVGYVGGPVLLVAAVWLGAGWRGATLALAVASVPLVLWASRLPAERAGASEPMRAAVASSVRALRNREVLRWLVVLEAADLLLDVLHAFLALYLVDVGGFRPVDAAVGVAVWTGAGLVGDALLVPLLARVRGRRYLRVSACAALVAYPALLVVPSAEGKLVLLAVLGLLNSGWYAIPKAGLYDALPGRSGTAVAVGGVAGLAGATFPLALGLAADAVGLGVTMWFLLAGPLVILALVPAGRHSNGSTRKTG